MSFPPAMRPPRTTSRPVSSWTVNCCAHWQLGSASGFCCTVAGRAVRDIVGTKGGPAGGRKGTVNCRTHGVPFESDPLKTNTRFRGAASPDPENDPVTAPLAGMLVLVKLFRFWFTPSIVNVVSFVAPPAFSRSVTVYGQLVIV